jgi:hypothetical protein
MIDRLARRLGLPAPAAMALLFGAFAVAFLVGLTALVAIVRLVENY